MGDLDNFVPMPESSGEAGATGNEGGNEAAREQMQEQFRQASARAQQVRRDEQKTKGRDVSLAKIIASFVKGDVDDQILNTILSLLRQEVSGEFILGILSLYYPNVQKAIYAEPEAVEKEENEEEYMQIADAKQMMEAKLLTMTLQPEVQDKESREFDEHDLPENVKRAINQWLQDLMYTAFLHPVWLLPRIFHKEKVNTTCIQLASFILERYLASQHITGTFEKVQTFAAYIIDGVVRRTHAHVYDAKRLSSTTSTSP